MAVAVATKLARHWAAGVSEGASRTSVAAARRNNSALACSSTFAGNLRHGYFADGGIVHGGGGIGGAVVLPLPGALLTNRQFVGVSLASALGIERVDNGLGEAAALDAATLPDAADLVAAGLTRRYGKNARALLVGHSYGGYMALEFARRWPSRLAGLVLISTQCRADTAGAAARRLEQVKMLRCAGVDAVLDCAMPRLLSRSALADTALKAEIRSMAHSVGAGVFERQALACAMREDHCETLLRLAPSVPVLVVSGKEDRVTPPRCADEIRDLLIAREKAQRVGAALEVPGAVPRMAPWRMSSFAGCGHLACLERPDALREVLSGWAAEIRAFEGSADVESRKGISAQ